MADTKQELVIDLDLIPGAIIGDKLVKGAVKETKKAMDGLQKALGQSVINPKVTFGVKYKDELKGEVKQVQMTVNQMMKHLVKNIGLDKALLADVGDNAVDSLKQYFESMERATGALTKKFGAKQRANFSKLLETGDVEAFDKLSARNKKSLNAFVAQNSAYIKLLEDVEKKASSLNNRKFVDKKFVPILPLISADIRAEISKLVQEQKNYEKVLKAFTDPKQIQKAKVIAHRKAILTADATEDRIAGATKTFPFKRTSDALRDEIRYQKKLRDTDTSAKGKQDADAEIDRLSKLLSSLTKRKNEVTGSGLQDSQDQRRATLARYRKLYDELRAGRGIDQLSPADIKSLKGYISGAKSQASALLQRATAEEEPQAAKRLQAIVRWQDRFSRDLERAGKASTARIRRFNEAQKTLQATIAAEVKRKEVETLQKAKPVAESVGPTRVVKNRGEAQLNRLLQKQFASDELAKQFIEQRDRLRQSDLSEEERKVSESRARSLLGSAYNRQVGMSVDANLTPKQRENAKQAAENLAKQQADLSLLIKEERLLTAKTKEAKDATKALADATERLNKEQEVLRSLNETRGNAYTLAKRRAATAAASADKAAEALGQMAFARDQLAAHLDVLDTSKRNSAKRLQEAKQGLRSAVEIGPTRAVKSKGEAQLNRLLQKQFASDELAKQFIEQRDRLRQSDLSEEERKVSESRARSLLGSAYNRQVGMSVDANLTPKQRENAKQAAENLAKQQANLSLLIKEERLLTAKTKEAKDATKALADATERLNKEQEVLRSLNETRGNAYTLAKRRAATAAASADKAAELLGREAFAKDELAAHLDVLDAGKRTSAKSLQEAKAAAIAVGPSKGEWQNEQNKKQRKNERIRDSLYRRFFTTDEARARYEELRGRLGESTLSDTERTKIGNEAASMLHRAKSAQNAAMLDPNMSPAYRGEAKKVADALLAESTALADLINNKKADVKGTKAQQDAYAALKKGLKDLATAQNEMQFYALSGKSRRFDAAEKDAKAALKLVEKNAAAAGYTAAAIDARLEHVDVLEAIDRSRAERKTSKRQVASYRSKFDTFQASVIPGVGKGDIRGDLFGEMLTGRQRTDKLEELRKYYSSGAAGTFQQQQGLLSKYNVRLTNSEKDLASLELDSRELGRAINAARKVSHEEATQLIGLARQVKQRIKQAKVLLPQPGLPEDQASYLSRFQDRLRPLRAQADAAALIQPANALDLKAFNRDHVNPLRQALGSLRREFVDLIPEETLQELNKVHRALDQIQEKAKQNLPANIEKKAKLTQAEQAMNAEIALGARNYQAVGGSKGLQYLKAEQYQSTLAFVDSELKRINEALQSSSKLTDAERTVLDKARVNYQRDRNHLKQDILGNISLIRQIGTAVNSFMRYAVVYGSLYQLSAAFSGLVRNVVNFQDSLKQIQAIAQATDGQMVSLASAIRSVASTSPYNMQELAASAQTLAQAGIDIQKLPSALRAVSQMAAATGGDTNTAADILTSAQRIFPKLSDQQIADQITRTVNISKLNPNDIQTIFNLAAQTASASNVKSSQFLGTAATLSNLGIKGSTIATGLRQLMLELFSPDPQLTQFYRSRYAAIGETNMNDAAIRTKFMGFQKTDDPMGAAFAEMKRLGIGAGGPASDQFRRIMETRAENVGLPLLRLLDILEENIKRVADSIGAAAEGAAVRNDTLVKALGNLGDELESTADVLGESLLQSLKELAKGGTDAVRSIRAEIDERKAKGQSITPNILPTVAATLGAAMAAPAKGMGRVVFGALGGLAAGLSTTAAEGVGPVFSAITNWLITLLSITQILKAGIAKTIDNKLTREIITGRAIQGFMSNLGKLFDVVKGIPKLFGSGGLAKLATLVADWRLVLATNPLGILLGVGSLALELFDLIRSASPEDRLNALRRQAAQLKSEITNESPKEDKAKLVKLQAEAAKAELEVALAKPNGLGDQKKVIDDLASKTPSRENLDQLRQYRDAASRIMMGGGDSAGPASTLQGYIQGKMDAYIDNLTRIEAASKERADAEQQAAAVSAARLQELTTKEAALQERRIALMQNEEADNARRREIEKRINAKEDKNALLDVVRPGGLLDQRAAMERDKLAIDAEQAKLKFEVKAVENKVNPDDLRQVVHSNNPEVLTAYETYKAAQEKLRDLTNQTEDERQRIMRGMRPDNYEPSPEAKKALDRAREIENQLYDERLETEESLRVLFEEWKRLKLFVANEEIEHVKARKDQFDPRKPQDFGKAVSTLEERRDEELKTLEKKHDAKLKQILDQRDQLEIRKIEKEISQLQAASRQEASSPDTIRQGMRSLERGRAAEVSSMADGLIRRRPNASLEIVGNAQGHMGGLDPDLYAAMQEAAHYIDAQVQVISAVNGRSTGTKNHPGGKAADIRLIKDGKALDNYRNAQTFRDYEEYWQIVKAILSVNAPGKPFRFGGYFGDTWGDVMHGDVTSNNTALGSWESGASEALRRKLPGMQSQGMGDVSRFASRLEGLTTQASSRPAGNADIALQYFIDKGLSPVQAAGFVGSLMQESHPRIDTTLGANNPKAPLGAAQWRGSRRLALEAKANPLDLRTQLDFAWEELNNSEKEALQLLSQAQTIEEAVAAAVKFERPGKAEANVAARIQYAQDLLSAPSGTTPFDARSSRIDELNRRLLGIRQNMAGRSGNPVEMNAEAVQADALATQERLTQLAENVTDMYRGVVRNRELDITQQELQGVPYGSEAAAARDIAGMAASPAAMTERLMALETLLLAVRTDVVKALTDVTARMTQAQADYDKVDKAIKSGQLSGDALVKADSERTGYERQVAIYEASHRELTNKLLETNRAIGGNRQEQQVYNPTLKDPGGAYGQISQAFDVDALVGELNKLGYAFNKLGENIRSFTVRAIDTFITTLADSIINGAQEVDTTALQEAQANLRDAQAEAAYQQAVKSEEIRRLQQAIDAEGIDSAAAKRRKAALQQSLNESIDARNQAISVANEQARQQQLASEQSAMGTAMEGLAKEGGSTLLKTAMLYPFQKILESFGFGGKGTEQDPMWVRIKDSKDPTGLTSGSGGFFSDIFDGIFGGSSKPSESSSISSILGTVGSFFGGFFADGGHVKGPGTGTSDSIPAWLSNGEYVLTAKEVQAIGLPNIERWKEAMKTPAKFATGGLVGRFDSASSGVTQSPFGGGNTEVNIIDQRSTANSSPVETQRRQGPDGKEVLDIMVRDAIKKAINSGQLDRTMSANFGARRVGGAR